MPRTARKISQSGIYHVTLKGIDYRNIFLEENDYFKFLDYIVKSIERNNCKVYAYCLMTNHVHILVDINIEDNNVEIGQFVKSITIGYVQYHNNKYIRTGHLFQNRFFSEPVEDDSYLLSVQRYIHQNPLKARIVNDLNNYKWSSYKEYISEIEEICDTSLLLEMFNNKKEFIDFTLAENDDKILGNISKVKYSDDDLRTIILKKYNINKIMKMDIDNRNKELKKIIKITKASRRQLSRVLGIGLGIINRL